MTAEPTFEGAALAAVTTLGAAAVRTLADRIQLQWPPDAIRAAFPLLGAAEARALADPLGGDPARAEATTYLRALAAGPAAREAELSVETVWSGPASAKVPVQSTAQVLIGIVGEAEHELVMTTYSAKPYQPLIDALTAAISRGVAVSVVVETLQGAGSALNEVEPAAAFSEISGLGLWHWPPAKRTEPRAKMHAKIAIVDRRVLLVTSANLTQSGVGKNIEAGILVRGGSAPLRAFEHLRDLQEVGTLQRL